MKLLKCDKEDQRRGILRDIEEKDLVNNCHDKKVQNYTIDLHGVANLDQGVSVGIDKI
jgi:hypothetical protein